MSAGPESVFTLSFDWDSWNTKISEVDRRGEVRDVFAVDEWWLDMVLVDGLTL
jgi:hypothetical protein